MQVLVASNAVVKSTISKAFCPRKAMIIIHVELCVVADVSKCFAVIPSLDPCLPNPCNRFADCVDIEGKAICTCRLGFIGDGFDCEGEFCNYQTHL